jgi:DNA (cytosine-5)-methyltransferase 1
MAFRHVDLCSGIGGFALGFEWAELSSPILFCDIEPWSRKILAKHWPHVPIATDVKELASDPDRNVPDCDILTAGYPCQPFSLAGKRGGEEDPRHIWPYILRIVASKRPSWCVFENVYGHLTLGLDQVLLDLEAEGYATRPFIVPACSVDAPHRRDRVWIIAKKVRPDTDSKRPHRAQEYKHGEAEPTDGQERDSGSFCKVLADSGSAAKRSAGDVADTYNTRQPSSQGSGKDNRNKSGNNFGWSGQDVADTYNSGREEQRWPQPAQPKHQAPQRGSGWLPEPAVGRVANGIPRRVDRLKGLGNAIVPQIAMQIGKTIKAVHDIPAQGYAHNNSNNQTT